MKKKYYGILLAAVIAAGTMGVTVQAAELADRGCKNSCVYGK